MTKRTRKMLMTIRAALIMAAKAIEEYCKDETLANTDGPTAET